MPQRMDCYIEILAGLIRIGPHAHQYPDPYELVATFGGDAGVATIKGLVVPKTRIIRDGVLTEENRYSLRESREIFNTVSDNCRALGLEPIYERIKSVVPEAEVSVVISPEVLKVLPQLRRK